MTSGRTGAPSQRAPAPAAGPSPAPELAALRSAAAVRERCRMVHRFVADGRSAHFTLDQGRLEAVADYVAQVTRAAYPDLNIPYHSRWRHFSAGGVDRWRALAEAIDADPLERARIAVALATVRVRLAAGAGAAGGYGEPAGGLTFARSEGLAVASLAMFRAGGFSSDARQPCRADAAALGALDGAALARHFQADAGNPLV